MSDKNKGKLCSEKDVYIMAADPIHIGTGGTRLGGVDNAIVRDAGTGLPKLPGSSLHGMMRSYAARVLGRDTCAGQGSAGEGREGHCRDDQCPICNTFGHFHGRDKGRSGIIHITDALILLFPVSSSQGPVWVTSPFLLQQFNLDNGQRKPEKEEALSVNRFPAGEKINLNWLLLSLRKDDTDYSAVFKDVALPDYISNRIVVIHDTLISHLINSNLEVRTSVAIDPKTGAAEENALFTYEALPRGTVMGFKLLQDNYLDQGSFQTKKGNLTPMEVALQGLELGAYLGVGGMTTRGFGRFVCLKTEKGDGRGDD